MPSYETVDERFPTFRRGDGVEQMLVPVPRCELCFKPIPEKFAKTRQCYDCYNGSSIDGDVLERVVAATLYIPKASGYAHSPEILQLKDKGRFANEYASVLLHVFAREGLKFSGSSVLVPVPQTTPHQFPAGPEALANALSAMSGVPVLRALSFVRTVQSQKRLKRADRQRNVENSMVSEQSVKGKTVYLVDDVLTTGDTMHEGARAVRDAGAVSVIGLVAGRDADLQSLERAGVIKRVAD